LEIADVAQCHAPGHLDPFVTPLLGDDLTARLDVHPNIWKVVLVHDQESSVVLLDVLDELGEGLADDPEGAAVPLVPDRGNVRPTIAQGAELCDAATSMQELVRLISAQGWHVPEATRYRGAGNSARWWLRSNEP